MYQADPNNSKKQIPKARSVNAYGTATTPAEKTFVKRPNYVLVNMNGTYAFSYQATGSIGGTHAEPTSYVTGSVIDDAAGPVRLDIQPNAWKQTDTAGEVGDVTFVYLGDVG